MGYARLRVLLLPGLHRERPNIDTFDIFDPSESIDTGFIIICTSHKINHDKLDDSARKLLGLYEIRPADTKEHSCRMQIHASALTTDEVPMSAYRAEGIIKNVNTIEEYRNIDKNQMLQQAGKTVWDAINDGTIYSCPSLLASFLVLSYADLKKYRFSYWFAFPAIALETPWVPVTDGASSTDKSPHRKLDTVESTTLVDKVQTWRYSVDTRQWGFFLAKKIHKSTHHQTPGSDELVGRRDDPLTAQAPSERAGYTWAIAPLAAFETGFFEDHASEDCYVCFADPSNYGEQDQIAPGWMLRNLLALVKQRWQRDRVQVLCFRETQIRRDAARSVILNLEISKQKKESSGTADPAAMPKIVGWERNAQGKLSGRFADLTEYMDPHKLADSSVDLNLKLMKWRISPNLDLDAIKETKCLLLGAGTLGSYVSRNLLGWGVRKITFVDNGRVSYSNPVRQPLFNFNDCQDGGAPKAERAAAALKEIYPGVDAEGHVMSVPMAGHPVTDEVKTKGEFEKLKSLVDEHDAIFLLMDSRESRWLPTVMGKATGKIVMNAALGFDTFLVMRHGVNVAEGFRALKDPGPGLGCYFCNDVVAPADSQKDLTLDQQCTVTRPGIAAIASALLVELLVSILQHPMKAAAPAPASSTEDSGDHPLGLVPHQIRGFLSRFQNMNIVGRPYDCCSACSDKIVDAYKGDGWAFVKKALNEKGYVEELSGLKEVQRAAEAAAADIDFDDEEDDTAEDEEGELI